MAGNQPDQDNKQDNNVCFCNISTRILIFTRVHYLFYNFLCFTGSRELDIPHVE